MAIGAAVSLLLWAAAPLPAPPPEAPPAKAAPIAPVPLPATLAPAPASATLAPPSVTVVLRPARPRLRLGTDKDLIVEVEVTGPDARGFEPARALASVGALDLPRATHTPGRFVTSYVPPSERFPQVAILVVELAAGSRRVHARAQIALDGATVVPFHTSPGAAVTMRVGDQTFGPVTADRQGHVDIPIVVPPGVRVGTARAVDHNAAARETAVDLQLPAFPRVLILAPTTLEVAAFAEIAVLGVDPNGQPSAAGGLSLAASDGIVHALGAGVPGEARFLFEAPRRLGGGAVALTATASGAPPARADVAVPLVPGAPARLVLAPSRRQLVVGSGDSAEITLSARDGFGNLTPATTAAVRIDGQAQSGSAGADGVVRLTLAAPAIYAGRDRIAIEASLGALTAAESVRLTGGPPVKLTLEFQTGRVLADGQRGTELRARAVDRNGTPTTVPGLSWETPEGRIRNVSVPRDGEYVAEYVPDAAREPHRQTVAVMASRSLRATAGIEVAPPPVHLVASMRAGLFTNFGSGAGPAAFLEAVRPFEIYGRRLSAGVVAGYLHSDTLTGFQTSQSVRVVVDQIPVMLVARARRVLSPRVEIAADIAAGMSWADLRLRPSGGRLIDASALALALGAGGDMSFPLRPGRLVIGLHYLWIELGRTSAGDRIDGNSAGLVGDIGYRMPF
jgi:hypothetical protein